MRRIKQITITNLFGMFNYVIPLHLDDRITIIHGPNGFGKTIILKLLSEIFSRSELHFYGRNNPTLRTLPFDQLCIEFDDGIRFCLTKSYPIYPATAPDNVAHEDLPISQITFQLLMAKLENTIAELKYTEPYIWMYHPTLEGALAPISPFPPEPEWLAEIRSAIVIHFIEIQQLTNKTSIIDELTSISTISSTEHTVDIGNKIELLMSIVNKRFRFKHMEISKEQGFIFTTSNGASLAPTDLSSGEQHQLVLFYELLFKVPPGSLILIDEPELSLHVVWQEHFLHDVQEITKLSDIDVLLTTHSPDLISDRRDLVVYLSIQNWEKANGPFVILSSN